MSAIKFKFPCVGNGFHQLSSVWTALYDKPLKTMRVFCDGQLIFVHTGLDLIKDQPYEVEIPLAIPDIAPTPEPVREGGTEER